MNTKLICPVMFALLLGAGSALAAGGKVTITSVTPKEPYAKDKITLNYDAVAGPEGGHLHLNVDGKRVDVIHAMKGSTELGPLPSGKHHICLAINTEAHVPTGVESCVDVMIW